MKITLKCACGATFDGTADANAMQTADLMALSQGWQADHADHAYLKPVAATPQTETRDALTKMRTDAARLAWGPYDVLGYIERWRDRYYPDAALTADSEEP
jgi:hypothetical protein